MPADRETAVRESRDIDPVNARCTCRRADAERRSNRGAFGGEDLRANGKPGVPGHDEAAPRQASHGRLNRPDPEMSVSSTPIGVPSGA